MRSIGECSFLGVADARYCGAFRIIVLGSGSGNFGESGGCAIPTK